MNVLSIGRLVVPILLLSLWAPNPQSQALKPSQTTGLEYQRKPGQEWRSKQATTVKLFLGKNEVEPPELSAYGGLLGKQFKATGFFYTQKIRSRWWLIDPDGHPLIRMGLNSVYRRTRSNGTDILPPELQAHIKAEGGRRWTTEATEVLRDLGVNSLGRWSEYEVFNDTGARFPYTTSFKFMASFGRELGVTYEKYGHMGYREDCIPVFHPEFPKFCDEYARKNAASLASDPFLVGHYTDNEMPVKRDLLKNTLSLDPGDEQLKYNRQEAWRWYKKRRGASASIANITAKDAEAYLGHVYNHYYKTTTTALRKHDPNHLVLGSRLHGGALKIEPVFRAAGKHLDIVSFNTYHYWDLSQELMDQWADITRRPFIVSEFCIKGQDSGLPNAKGAGWVVRTQQDRGVWYQNFLINLLHSKHCVGWDYFKYRDDVDVNKGVLTVDFKPHTDFYTSMQQIHQATYQIIQTIDSKPNR